MLTSSTLVIATEQMGVEQPVTDRYQPQAGEPKALRERLRIALLTPYTGGNFGDGAIQDSMIAALKERQPSAEFSGISLNNENYLRRHGSAAFSLCAVGRSFYGMSSSSEVAEDSAHSTSRRPSNRSVRRSVSRLLGLGRIASALKSRTYSQRLELQHWRMGYRFLRGHDLLVVCGGGQLDEEWGGPWGHPFALLKWAIMAALARRPLAIVSVGACRVESRLSRLFLGWALRLATYRSYRDATSKRIAACLYSGAANDASLLDLAFGLSDKLIPPATDLRARSEGRRIIAVSPIVYGKKGVWPSANDELHDRYLSELGKTVGALLRREYFVVFVWTSESDEGLVPEILARVDEEAKSRFAQQVYLPKFHGWTDVLAILQSVDLLIASRLHSTILGFVARVPVIALSFDSKVERVMQDLQQTDVLLQISDFTTPQILSAIDRVEAHHECIVKTLSEYRSKAIEKLSHQADQLMELANSGVARR